MTRTILDIVLTIVAAGLPAMAVVAFKMLMANKKAATIVNALKPLAEAAVQASQKFGEDKWLDGETQRLNAIAWVKDNLHELGLGDVEYNIIANAVEQAYQEVIKNV